MQINADLCAFVAVTHNSKQLQQQEQKHRAFYELIFFFHELLQINEKTNKTNAERRLDQHLMRRALIRSFMAANVLPSHPRGPPQSAPAVGMIVLIIALLLEPEKRLLSHFGTREGGEKKQKKKKKLGFDPPASRRAFLRLPLFSLSFLMSLSLETPCVSCCFVSDSAHSRSSRSFFFSLLLFLVFFSVLFLQHWS